VQLRAAKSETSMAESISLNCSVLGKIHDTFVVEVVVKESTLVYELMRAINNEARLDFATKELVLWKVSSPEQRICHYCVVTRLQLSDPILSGDIANKLGNIVDGAKIPGAQRLERLKPLSHYFTGFAGSVDSICLLVQVPSPGLTGECQPFLHLGLTHPLSVCYNVVNKRGIDQMRQSSRSGVSSSSSPTPRRFIRPSLIL
jgi:hypothetical protein